MSRSRPLGKYTGTDQKLVVIGKDGNEEEYSGRVVRWRINISNGVNTDYVFECGDGTFFPDNKKGMYK